MVLLVERKPVAGPVQQGGQTISLRQGLPVYVVRHKPRKPRLQAVQLRPSHTSLS